MYSQEKIMPTCTKRHILECLQQYCLWYQKNPQEQPKSLSTGEWIRTLRCTHTREQHSDGTELQLRALVWVTLRGGGQAEQNASCREVHGMLLHLYEGQQCISLGTHTHWCKHSGKARRRQHQFPASSHLCVGRAQREGQKRISLSYAGW